VGNEINNKNGGIMKEAALIAKLNDLFPGVRATPLKEWDDTDEPGIWFRGNDVGDLPLYDCYEEYGYEVNPEVEKVLTKAGWEAYPYDAGTLMAYPN
jgi:hypothetical protein|tara:strand:- start:68 stop:358 length:291 start_codon:yes stop_codon:yes gene_type:complete